MKHYDRKRWSEYYKNGIAAKEKFLMEEHLMKCDECLGLYLDVVEGNLDCGSACPTSTRFTQKVMDDIHRQEKMLTARIKRSRKLELAVYYAAAACVTMMITFSGGFRVCNENITAAAKNLSSSVIRVESKLKTSFGSSILPLYLEMQHSRKK